LWSLSETELIDKLGLTDRVSENFTFLNPLGTGNDTVIKFDTSGEYLKYFIDERQRYYDIRKRYQLDKLKEEILKLKERINFIEKVNSGDIVITRRKKNDLEKELTDKGYIKIDGTFDHLLGMKMYALTEENVARFKVEIESKEKEFNVLEKTPTEDIHIKELQTLLKFVDGELHKKGFLE
jgi:DNA topoisomerase-2